VADDDVCHNERFRLHTSSDGRMLVFCAYTELAVLHQSEFWVCDGTFEMSPNTAFQQYTVHGYKNGEGLPLLWALLPNKTTATYTELFTAIRDALITSFGNIGNVTTVLTDFELAAIKSIHIAFPEIMVKGCSFHFRQAVMRRVQHEGLKAEYENVESEVRLWIRSVMSMTMLPAFAIPLAWQFLQYHPTTGRTETDTKSNNIAAYFSATWINGEFPPNLWSHFDNTGPRTTNLAEGYHNALNSRFGIPHPSLQVFLHFLQDLQCEVQSRVTQLESGRPPKQSTTYRRVTEGINMAKLTYSMNIGKVFADVFPNDFAWNMFRQHTLSFLAHVAHLFGLN